MLGRGMRLLSWGMAPGILLAMVAGVALQRVLPEAELRPSMIVLSVTALVPAALMAIVVPAVRALRLDPLTALRAD